MEQYKILIVDDDPDIREVVSILLGSEGYSVLQAENGGTAVETQFGKLICAYRLWGNEEDVKAI